MLSQLQRLQPLDEKLANRDNVSCVLLCVPNCSELPWAVSCSYWPNC